jgi:hypothetical protein
MGGCVVRFIDDLAHIPWWSMSNGLFLNPNKTEDMFICRSRVAVVPPRVVVTGGTICGMTLNDRLTFDDYINDLCSKVHYSLQNLWSASEYISGEFKLRLVKVLVIPQFLFDDVLFRMADSTSLRNLRSLSIIVYGLFMACGGGVTIMSLNIAEISWAVVFQNTTLKIMCDALLLTCN